MPEKDEAKTEQVEPVQESSDFWPGNIARYRELRATRESMEQGDPADTTLEALVGMNIAEELAGIANLLNNISYLQRNPRS